MTYYCWYSPSIVMSVVVTLLLLSSFCQNPVYFCPYILTSSYGHILVRVTSYPGITMVAITWADCAALDCYRDMKRFFKGYVLYETNEVGKKERKQELNDMTYVWQLTIPNKKLRFLRYYRTHEYTRKIFAEPLPFTEIDA